MSLDLKKTGLFIAQLRRAQNLTQSQLARQLGVTDKAVSRWETGRGFPDAGILAPLAQTLGVSVTELVRGESMPIDTSTQAQSDALILETLLRTRRMVRKMVGLLLLLFGAATIAFRFLYVVGQMETTTLVLGVGMVVAGILLLLIKQERLQNDSRAKRRFQIGTVVTLLLALLLQLLPWGVRMVFAAGPETRIVQYCTYFSLLPFGYGNIFPFLTAFLTCMILILLLIPFLRGKAMPRLQMIAFFLTAAAAVLAALSVFLWGHVTLVGAGILAMLIICMGMQFIGNYRVI